jgi:hypothetical protein
VSAIEKWVIPPGYDSLVDIVREYGRDQAQTNLMSGQWPAFKFNLTTGGLEPIPATTWCAARGHTWLEKASNWESFHSDDVLSAAASFAVIVRISERLQPKQRKAPQAERIGRVIAKCFPDGTDRIPTKAVHKAVAEELATDSKKQGLAIPSESSVKRALGRRK